MIRLRFFRKSGIFLIGRVQYWAKICLHTSVHINALHNGKKMSKSTSTLYIYNILKKTMKRKYLYILWITWLLSVTSTAIDIFLNNRLIVQQELVYIFSITLIHIINTCTCISPYNNDTHTRHGSKSYPILASPRHFSPIHYLWLIKDFSANNG